MLQELLLLPDAGLACMTGHVPGAQEYCKSAHALWQVTVKFVLSASLDGELICANHTWICRPDIPAYAGADEPLLAYSMDDAHRSQSVVSVQLPRVSLVWETNMHAIASCPDLQFQAGSGTPSYFKGL